MRLSKKLRFRFSDEDGNYSALDDEQREDFDIPSLTKGKGKGIAFTKGFSEDDEEKTLCIETSTLSTGEMSTETSLSSPPNSPRTPTKSVTLSAAAVEELVKDSRNFNDESALACQKSNRTLLRFDSVAWSCSEFTQQTGGSAFDDRSCQDWSVITPWGIDKAQEDIKSFLSKSHDGDSAPVYTAVNKIKSKTVSSKDGKLLSELKDEAYVEGGKKESDENGLGAVSTYARNARVAELKAKKRRLEEGKQSQNTSSSRDYDNANTSERIISMSPREIATDQEILDEIKRLQISFMQALDIDAIEDDDLLDLTKDQ